VEHWYRVAVLSVGGVLGVNARYWLGVILNRWTGSQFPWATFTINVSGSFAIGMFSVLLARWLPHPHLRLLVVVGFLGGYTTFSSFSFESLSLWERGEWVRCLGYMAGSVACGFAAVLVGTAVGRGLSDGVAAPAVSTGAVDVPAVVEKPTVAMIPADARLLSILVGADTRHDGARLYEFIVGTARALKIAGASVFPVEASYGRHREIHDLASDYSFMELPVLIEIVEAPERIDLLLASLGGTIATAFVTVERVEVILYAHTEVS
jgi:CrcB protein